VSDGFPQDWLDSANVRHIRLGRPHNDAGNTPRGLGALLAVSEGYDGIGLLDADNWYDEDHIAADRIAASPPIWSLKNAVFSCLMAGKCQCQKS
jgi:hypothetical protein